MVPPYYVIATTARRFFLKLRPLAWILLIGTIHGKGGIVTARETRRPRPRLAEALRAVYQAIAATGGARCAEPDGGGEPSDRRGRWRERATMTRASYAL